jgi:hypothetical protein
MSWTSLGIDGVDDGPLREAHALDSSIGCQRDELVVVVTEVL